MSKSKKIVLIILAVVLVISGTVAGLSTKPDIVKKILGGIGTGSAKDISEVSQQSFGSDYPVVQTQQKNLFYIPHPDGFIDFVTFKDGAFTSYGGEVKTKDIKITCSNQKIPVKLYYTSTDAGTVGYGLYTAKQNADTKLFSYVFVRMTDCPKALKKEAATAYIIAADMDAEDAFKANKTYSELFSFNLSSGTTVLMSTQRDRLVQEDGTYREDWTIFTDNSLNTMDSKDLFASARTSDTRAEELTYNMLTFANARHWSKNSASTVNGCPSWELWEKDGAYYCFVNTKDGFDIVKNGDRKNPIASFSGNFSEYAVSGEWIMHKSEAVFTNVFTGQSISGKKTVYDKFYGFTANSDGTKFVYFTSGETKSMVMIDAKNGDSTVVADENLFDGGILNFCFVDESTFIVSAYGENGADNRICNF